MPTNPEGKYEDSYQRSDRLIQELKTSAKEARHFFELTQKAIAEAKAVPDKIKELGEKSREKRKRLDDLETEIEDLKTKMTGDIDHDIDIQNQLLEKENQLSSTISELDSLSKEIDDLIKNEPALWGDAEGLSAVTELKLRKADEAKEELENEK